MAKKVLGILGILLCFVIGALAVLNCSRNRVPVNYDSSDTTCVCCDLQNTTLNSVEDLYAFQQDLIDEEATEFQFLNLPKQTLENIAHVLHKRGIPLTMKSVVSEYLSNTAIYDNLPPTEDSELKDTAESTNAAKDNSNGAKDNSSGMEDQRVTGDKPQNTVSYNEQDTTIDGHKAKVLIRKEVQYE